MRPTDGIYPPQQVAEQLAGANTGLDCFVGCVFVSTLVLRFLFSHTAVSCGAVGYPLKVCFLAALVSCYLCCYFFIFRSGFPCARSDSPRSGTGPYRVLFPQVAAKILPGFAAESSLSQEVGVGACVGPSCLRCLPSPSQAAGWGWTAVFRDPLSAAAVEQQSSSGFRYRYVSIAGFLL